MKTKRKITIIYTGGTIGSRVKEKSKALAPVDFDKLEAFIPELKRLDIDTNVIAFAQPKDSSNMQPEDWITLTTIIKRQYDKTDGFVILHGTDAMVYSASALSFLCENIKKPVIFTGSQLPLGDVRTDARENLLSAIEIAAKKNKHGDAIVQEVGIYFENKLLRANRSIKYSASAFNAFKSPNYPILAKSGIKIRINYERLYRTKGKPKFYNKLSGKIALLPVFPGINFDNYSTVFQNNQVKALLLEVFGSGNFPQNNKMEKQISAFIKAGGIVCYISQCNHGSMLPGKYVTGQFLAKSGALPGYDITREAAICKLMYLMGRYKDSEKIMSLFSIPLRGEMSAS